LALGTRGSEAGERYLAVIDARRPSTHVATIPPRLMVDLGDALRIHLAL
jgi:hypothetical protein